MPPDRACYHLGMKRWAVLVAVGCIAACGGSDERPPGVATLGTGINPSAGTEGTASASGTSAETASGTAGGDSSDDGSPPGFDVGNGDPTTDPDGEQDEGCDKVDVILAVDNSGSMSEEHDALRGPVFDSFPQALLDINNGIEDFQLAVIDACPKPAYFHDHGEGGACNYSTGTNYMVSSSPNLAAEFSCVTQFSGNGFQNMPDQCIDDGAFADDDEQPALTAAESVSVANLAAQNAGFVRDDAILFVVTITDEDEELADVGSAQEIYDRLVAAKGGDVENVVYMGIAGNMACAGPYGTAIDATVAKQVASLFAVQGQGLFWDLCQGNLEDAFQTAISTLVDETCQGFTPPEG